MYVEGTAPRDHKNAAARPWRDGWTRRGGATSWEVLVYVKMIAGFDARQPCRGRLLGAVVLTSLLGSGQARAQPSFTVERAAGAESCPDAVWLAARIETIRGAQEQGHAQYRVAFTQAGEAFAASITAGSPGRRRTILSRRPTCVALGEATAVTLALLFDSDLLEEEQRKAQHQPEPAPSLVAPAVALVAPPPAPRAASLSVGAAGLMGALGSFSLAGTAELGGAIGRWRAGLGVLWALAQDHTLGPGSIRQELVSGLVRACYAAWQRQKVRVDLCSGAYAGAMTGDASGFTTNGRQARFWLALPAEVALAYRPTHYLAWELSAAALSQLRRDDFGIDGLGAAHRSPVVAGLLSLRAVALRTW